MDPIHHPTNAAAKHSFEFTLNRVLFKIFGALPKDSYRDICKYFGVDPIEEQISVRQRKFISRYRGQKATYVGRFRSYDSRMCVVVLSKRALKDFSIYCTVYFFSVC